LLLQSFVGLGMALYGRPSLFTLLEQQKARPARAARDQCARTAAAVGRRDFILGLIGVCSGVSAYVLGGRGEALSNADALGDWLRYGGTGFFTDLRALKRLGALYLVEHPEEFSRVRLSNLLIANFGGTIPARLSSAVARDWSSNHVAVVDGWLLARTEARLCALLHLEQDVGP
jgi:hypothetical protein